VLALGGGPNHDRSGFRYWQDPGAFVEYYTIGSAGRFLGVWAVFVQSAYSYMGTEIVAVTAGEAQNPQKTIPKAINRVLVRITLFYVLSMIVIGMNIPSNDPTLLSTVGGSTAAASPFVIMINHAGIPALPSIINAVVLTAAFSAANSDLYAASRTLYALAMERKAPALFTRCTKNGLPYYCVMITSLFGLLAYLNCSTSSKVVFSWLVNITTISGLFSWTVICICYVRFHAALKFHNISRDDLPYKSPFQPYSAYFGAIVCALIILFNGFTVFSPFNVTGFVSSYIGIPVFFGLYLGYKIIKRTKMVDLCDIDFTVTKGYEIPVEKMEEGEKRWWNKVMDFLF